MHRFAEEINRAFRHWEIDDLKARSKSCANPDDDHEYEEEDEEVSQRPITPNYVVISFKSTKS